MKVAIDCDDVGASLKPLIVEHLRNLGVEAVDLNRIGKSKVDYPDVGHHLAKQLPPGNLTAAFSSAAPASAWPWSPTR